MQSRYRDFRKRDTGEARFITEPQISRGVPSVFDRQCVEFYAFFYAAMYLNVFHETTARLLWPDRGRVSVFSKFQIPEKKYRGVVTWRTFRYIAA